MKKLNSLIHCLITPHPFNALTASLAFLYKLLLSTRTLTISKRFSQSNGCSILEISTQLSQWKQKLRNVSPNSENEFKSLKHLFKNLITSSQMNALMGVKVRLSSHSKSIMGLNQPETRMLIWINQFNKMINYTTNIIHQVLTNMTRLCIESNSKYVAC